MSKRLLWLSDSPFITTGFSNQSVSIVNGLANKYGWEGHYLAANGYQGRTLPPGQFFRDGTKLNFTIHGTDGSPYAQRILAQKIKEVQADVFGVLLDTFMLFPWYLNIDTTPAHTSFYFPSDGGGGLPLGCDQILRKVQLPVAMSKFAQTQAKDGYGISAEYIPHATYPDKFFLMKDDEREELRKQWGLKDKFVVGCVSRHQPRKQLDMTLRAFKIFAESRPDAVLLMHTDPQDPSSYFDLPSQIIRYGIQNRVLFTGTTYWKPWEDADMNKVYNLMDVFLLLTSGEGWGIPTMEAMSCEVPCVITDYTTTQELLVEDGRCGEPVKVLGELTGSWNVDRGMADVKDAADKLAELYVSKGKRVLYGKTGRSKVIKNYTWDVVLPKWNALFEKMLE